jgi:hypothetical protein
MAKVTTLKKPAPLDERAELRAAIAGADEAKATLARHREAIQKAKQETVPEAEAALRKLRAGEAEAKQKTAEGLALELGGVAGRTPARTQMRLMLYRDKLREAEERVAIARGALEHLTKTVPDAEYAVALAENQVLVEINTLLAPLVERLLAEGEEARRKFVAMRVALRALARDFEPLPKFARDAGGSFGAAAARAEPLGGLRDEAENFGRFGLYHTRDEETQTEFQVTALWHQAREALRRDPDAVLPEIR